jgi:hypothetical protein
LQKVYAKVKLFKNQAVKILAKNVRKRSLLLAMASHCKKKTIRFGQNYNFISRKQLYAKMAQDQYVVASNMSLT